ncbi:hypothetical protein ACFL54_01400 [Planctomycetota bacterium]
MPVVILEIPVKSAAANADSSLVVLADSTSLSGETGRGDPD